MNLRFYCQCVLFLTFAWGAAHADPVELPVEFQDREVSSIRLVTSIDAVTGLPEDYLPLKPGGKLTAETLSRSLQKLAAREVFAHVDVECELNGEMVDVVFYLSPRTRVSSLVFSGNDALTDAKLRRLSRIRIGEPLEMSRLLAARDLILAGYRDEGYFSAEITADIDRRHKDVEAVVVFEIREGYRSVISSIEFSEPLPLELEELGEKMITEGVGLPASNKEIQDLRLDYLGRLRRAGFLQSSLEIRAQNYSALSGDVELVISAAPREPMELEFRGNKKLSDSELASALDFETRTIPFTPYAVTTLARKVKKLYEQHGHYFAEIVHTAEEGDDGSELQVLTIDEGPLVAIDEIVFDGNRHLSDDELRSAMRTTGALSWPLHWFSSGYLIRQTLADDLRAISDLYESKGFLGSEVKSQVYHDRDAELLTVVVRIDEKPQVVIEQVQLRWEGAADWPIGDSRRYLISQSTTVQKGRLYDEQLVDAERRRLKRLIAEMGYPLVEVLSKFHPDQRAVEFVVKAGPKVEIGDTHLAGNVYTHDKVILRTLEYRKGQPWNPEVIDQAEEKLYKLGLFEQVSVRSKNGTFEHPVEDVLIRVRERDTGVYGATLGYNTQDGIAAGTEYAQRNVNGMGRSLVLSFKGFFKKGDRYIDAGHARLSYTHPHFLDSNVELVSDVFFQFAVKLVDQFSYDRIGGSVGVRYDVGENLEAQLLYRAYNEDLFDVEPDAVLGSNDEGETFYATLRPMLQHDMRDDVFNTQRGHLSQLEGIWSSSALGSNIDMGGMTARHTHYIPLSQTLVWAQSVRFRMFRAYSDDNVVPLSSRLFLGGRESLRGYSRNSLGPRSSGDVVVGGDTSFDSMSELRHSLTDNLVGVLFVDFGSSFLQEKGAFQENPLSWGDIRVSPGLGIRYRTPIGPLSLDYGVALDRRNGEGFGRLNFGIGAAF